MYGRRITASLGETARSGRRIALVGPAWVGKATLARTYVHRRAGSVLDLRDAATRERTAAAVDATLASLTPPVAVIEHHRIEGLVHRLAAVQDATDPTGQPWIVTSSVRSTAPTGSVTIEVASLTLDEHDHAPAPRFVRRLLEDGVDGVNGWQPTSPWSVQRLLQRAALGGFPQTAEMTHHHGVDVDGDRTAPVTPSAQSTDGLLAPVRAGNRLRHPTALHGLLRHHAHTAGGTPGADAATARELGVSAPTLQRYRRLLHDHYLLTAIPAAQDTASDTPGVTAGDALRHALVCDPGLATHTMGLSALHPPSADEPAARALLFTLLAHDLRVQAGSAAPGTRLAQHTAPSGRRLLALVDDHGGLIGVDVIAHRPQDGWSSADLRELATVVGDRWRGGVLLAPVDRATSHDDVVHLPLCGVWQLR